MHFKFYAVLRLFILVSFGFVWFTYEPNFYLFQERWWKNRCRERDPTTPTEYFFQEVSRKLPKTTVSVSGIGGADVDDVLVEESSDKRKVRRSQEGAFGADVSEDSSSATPSSQSPFHKVLKKTASTISETFGKFILLSRKVSPVSTRLFFHVKRWMPVE